LIDLQSSEMVVEKDISRMQEEMTALRAKINSKRDEQRRLQGRKKAIFAGMTAEAAFDLGQQVGRDSARKRRRTD
jgi:Skp family chaperone for outer membrane proteins